jgi:protein arginine N-methyltransferase 7
LTANAVFEQGVAGCTGLLGNNWLYHLEMAKKNVLQPGATVIPAAATVYCMGIEAHTGNVCGFDFSAFNKYRCTRSMP